MFFDLEAGKADAVHWLNLLYLLIYLVCFSYLFQVYRYSLFRFILNITPLVKPKPFTLKEAKYSFFLVYIVIFSFIYFLTNTGLTKRYLLPLFPAVFLIISFFIDIFWKKKVKKISVGLIIVVVLFLVGALNQVKFFLNCDNFAKGLKYKGYSYLYKIQSCP